MMKIIIFVLTLIIVTTFGISMPDKLAAQLDDIASDWYTTRSGALTRIFVEWRQYQMLLADTKQTQTDCHSDQAQRPVDDNSAQ